MHATTQAKRRHRIASMLAFAALCLIHVAISPAAYAASGCIADANGLTAALNYLETHEEVTTLNLEQGLYDVGAWDRVIKAPLQIVGGFKPGTLCATHEVDASKTIIDFGGADVTMWQKRGSPALLAFSDLTLRDGGVIDLIAGDYKVPPFLGQHDFPGQLTMNHVRVTNFANLTFDTYYGGARLTDVLFDHFHGGGCSIFTSPADASSYVFDHVTADLTGGGSFCFGDEGYDEDRDYTIANSIFWASDGSQAAIATSNGAGNAALNHVTIDHVLFKTFSGISGTIEVKNQVNADPQWVNPAAGDYRLKYPPQTLSPAINAGATVANVTEPFTDIAGYPRKIGSNTDLGAFESLYNDASNFVVTNTSDCGTPGCGSLRDAVASANATAAAAATISFNIAGGCPAVISLATPLPDIIKSMTINGYTQPNSAVNTDPLAFNAKLCTVVQPTGANAGFALRVGASSQASLTVRGIGFGYFPVPIELFGGKNHLIAGNQFGGYINNLGYQLFGSTVSAIYMDAANGQLTVGGSDPADRNVFLNVSSYTATPAAAINVGPDANGGFGDCQIVGNTFGIQDDGTFSSKNLDYGIHLQGNNCEVSENIIVGVGKDAIFIDSALGGGNGNVVRNNTIGLAPRGNLAGQNDGAGVRISGVHNVIGSTVYQGPSPADANTIWNMDGGGVVVVGQNAYGNTIRANWIQDNGAAHTGMSIDLGGDGPTVNDISDADSGPNNRQNFPTLHSIAWPSAPGFGTVNQSVVVSGLLRTFPGYYAVDVYYSDGCDATGKGVAQQWIGSTEAVYMPPQTYLVPFQAQAQVPVYLPGYGAISVTATNASGEGSTSEVSTCFPIDTIFSDKLEGGLGFD